MIMLGRRYARGHVTDVKEALFLRLVLADWDMHYLKKGVRVPLVTDEQEGTYAVTAEIRCPGGEPIAWAWLQRIGPLPNDHPPANEVRVSYAAQYGIQSIQK